MAVDNLASLDTRPVCPTARAANDDVRVDPQPRECGRKQRKGKTVAPPERREPVQRQRAHLLGRELGKRRAGLVQRRVQRGSGEGTWQRKSAAIRERLLQEFAVEPAELDVEIDALVAELARAGLVT